ncbi:MAG: hypothetical protein ABSG62_00235 [Terracidiphilus sp.]|jgi:hypothetical protein
MFELDQKVVVITGKGIAYEGFILARGKADDGSGAYKIGLEGAGFEQPGQWHKACDVFLEEPTREKEPYSSEPSWNDSPR